jgi:uncharacterized protein YjeT (DUF2065 family)
MMNWTDLLAALALYLVLEGILPFVNPQAMRRFLSTMANFSDRQLRIWGLVSMVAGLILLYAARS